MKKYIFLISTCILALTTSSCIKKYSCRCVTTLSKPGYYDKVTVTTQDIKKHSSKKKATQICNNTAKQLETNTQPLWDESVTVSSSCTIKENP